MTIEKEEVSKRLFKAAIAIRTPVKNATNPFLKNKYADLGEVIDCVKGPLQEFGLFVTQECRLGLDAKALTVVTKIIDAYSGEPALVSQTDVLLKQFDPQGTMSAFTYGRRYALLAMFNLAAEDDDANVASGKDEGATLSRAVPATLEKNEAIQALKANVGFTPTNKLK